MAAATLWYLFKNNIIEIIRFEFVFIRFIWDLIGYALFKC